MNPFNTVKYNKPNLNRFDLTHDVKQSGVIGELMPVLALECLPGDRFTLGCDTLLRFAPMQAPIMHRVDVSIHYFFVPNRLTWDNWEAFITNDPTAPVHPHFHVKSTDDPSRKRFLDYFGVPPNVAGLDVAINALPIAAYNKIYNDYYRDENLVAPIDEQLVDGLNPLANFCNMKKRAFEHDYFTAALPFAQKGTAVSIPLGTVILDPAYDSSLQHPHFVDGNGSPLIGDLTQLAAIPAEITGTPTVDPGAYDPDGTLMVGSTTINDLRTAYRLQEWLEKNARGGTRYTENVLVHFGVRSSDARLQRPEYITGVKSPVVISEVLNTTGPVSATHGAPQGDMAGHGVAVTHGKSGYYKCEEHGYIIGILSVMPKTAYQDGIPRHYLKTTFLDYAWPEFAHLGEQPITNREIFAYTPFDNQTFGYQARYTEYRYLPSRVAGDFRTTLDFWHMGRKFATLPALNQQFIECEDSDFSRIFSVQTGDNLWMHLLHRISADRPIPLFGSPSM